MGETIVKSEEGLVSEYEGFKQEEISKVDTTEGQATEKIHTIAEKDATGKEISQIYRGSDKEARCIVFFYMLVPIILAALYMAGTMWFFAYPSYTRSHSVIEALNFFHYPSDSFFTAFVITAPIYLLYSLSVLLRYYIGKPLNGITKMVYCIIIFCVWAYTCVFFFDKSKFVQQLDLLYRNAESIFSIGVFLFLLTVFIACFVILGYEASKHSVRIDFLLSTALCVVHIVICNFFIREGGLIYLVPFSEKYTTTEDFPIDKRATLESVLIFAKLNDYRRMISLYPEKQISYRDLLTMAAKSPSLLSSGYMKNHPKLYVHYLTNEILYPLSKDLAQKEYWESKLTVSSKHIEDYYYSIRSTVVRYIYLAKQYLSILVVMVNGNPEAAHK